MFAITSLRKWPIKMPNIKSLRLFPPSLEHVKVLLSKCTVLKIRFVIESSNTLFAGVYVCIFQPRNFTGWSNEGVNVRVRSNSLRELIITEDEPTIDLYNVLLVKVL